MHSNQQKPTVQYGYARSEDSERWSGNEDSIEGAIFEALTSNDIALAAPVFVCECEAPHIGYGALAEIVIENAEEQLFEEVGEVADTLGPFEQAEVEELAGLIKSWFDKHNAISCWKAVNIKRYAQGDAEYDAALARLIAAKNAFADFAGAA